MVNEHDWAFCLHVETPQQVKQEVSKADDEDVTVKLVWGVPNVSEWPGS